MARMRTLKPEYATSEAIAQLSIEGMLHFALLWTYADDAGRGVDNARLIKAALWPLRDEVTLHDIEGWQAELAKHGRIHRYEVDGRAYFEVTNFGEHQHPNRPVPSKLPARLAVAATEAPAVSTHDNGSEPAVSTHEQHTPVVEGRVDVGGGAASPSIESHIKDPTPENVAEFTETVDELTQIYGHNRVTAARQALGATKFKYRSDFRTAMRRKLDEPPAAGRPMKTDIDCTTCNDSRFVMPDDSDTAVPCPECSPDRALAIAGTSPVTTPATDPEQAAAVTRAGLDLVRRTRTNNATEAVA